MALTLALPGTVNEKVVIGDGFSSLTHPSGDVNLISSEFCTGLLDNVVDSKGGFFSFGTECMLTSVSVPDENSRIRTISINTRINIPSRV